MKLSIAIPLFISLLVTTVCYGQVNVLELAQKKNHTVQSEFIYDTAFNRNVTKLANHICDTSRNWNCQSLYIIHLDSSKKNLNQPIDVTRSPDVMLAFEKESGSKKIQSNRLTGTITTVKWNADEIELNLNLKVYRNKELLCIYKGRQRFAFVK